MSTEADQFLSEFTNDSGVPVPQKVVDKALSYGTGDWTGADLTSTLKGNGYVHSMVPGAIAGAGMGALLSALMGKNVLSGAGIGLGLGAGLGAVHQYFYDTNKDYAFNNPFTKFMETMMVPKDRRGIINAYNYIKDYVTESDTDNVNTKLVKQIIRNNSDKLKFNYNTARNWMQNGNEDIDLGLANIPAAKLRPHHLYYPLWFIQQRLNK